MERKRASDFPQELLDLFDHYVHGDIGRRAFLQRAGKFAVGGATAIGILEMLKPNYAWAQQVPKSDPRIRTETATVPSPKGNGSIKGYLVRPSDVVRAPTILVVHENRGLNPYIEDVARRFATEGYIAFAPDGLTSLGGYPGDDEKGGQLFTQLDRAKLAEDFLAAAEWLKVRSDGTGRVGVVGFCYGGGIANTLAVRMPGLAAAMPFYGVAPAAADVPKIRAAVQVHHARLDARLMEGWPPYESALRTHKVDFEGYVYDANHGFHNDTTPRFDQPSATLAWQRVLAFCQKHVRAG